MPAAIAATTQKNNAFKTEARLAGFYILFRQELLMQTFAERKYLLTKSTNRGSTFAGISFAPKQKCTFYSKIREGDAQRERERESE